MTSAYGYALALLIGASGAWYVQGVRWDNDVKSTETKLSQAREAQASKVSNDLLASWAATENMRQQFIDYKEGAKREISKLESDVSSGARGLHVNATCSTPAVQAAGANAGGTGAGIAELDASARSAYYALRQGLSDQFAALNFCRAELKKRSSQ